MNAVIVVLVVVVVAVIVDVTREKEIYTNSVARPKGLSMNYLDGLRKLPSGLPISARAGNWFVMNPATLSSEHWEEQRQDEKKKEMNNKQVVLLLPLLHVIECNEV